MGKAARNRLKRQAEEQRAPPVELIGELLSITSVSDLHDLFGRYPTLELGRLNDELHLLATMAAFQAALAPVLELISSVRNEPDQAWAEYQRWRGEVERLEPELGAVQAQVREALAHGDFDAVLSLARPAADRARSIGLIYTAHSLYSDLGKALLQRSSEDRAADMEQAIDAIETALALGVPNEVSSTLANLALVYVERVHGDIERNVDRAQDLLRQALTVGFGNDRESRARTQTNLAMALIRGGSGGRGDELQEAVGLCRDALRYRTPARDAVNWAYSTMNLGHALELLDELDGQISEEAISRYGRVIGQAPHINEPWLGGSAHHARGRLQLRAASGITVDEAGTVTQEGRRRVELLRHADADLRAAERLLHGAPSPLVRGHMLSDLGNIAAELGNIDEAITRDREALAILRPTAAPSACTAVARRLGTLLAEREDWAGSAAAYADAVEAAELSFHGRLATTARQGEIKRAGNLNRWAAFALAKASATLEAAAALENGRARELRRRVGLDPQTASALDGVPPELLETLAHCRDALARAPMDSRSDQVAYEYQTVLTEIRALPGHEWFATGARVEEVVAAVDEDWPLIYVNPTPMGTLLLCLHVADRAVRADAHFFPATALDVFSQLAVGHTHAEAMAMLAAGEELSGSYLLAVTGNIDEVDEFQRLLEQPLPWLGANIARHINDTARAIDARQLSLVCCGPIGTAPLHAATWEEDGKQLCLLDTLAVRYEPSAVVCAAARKRSARPQGAPRLVLLGDPSGDLPSARNEAEEVASHFQPGQVVMAIGDQADAAFLLQNAIDATHLHFASHAAASLLEGDDAAILLADGWLPAGDLATMRCPKLRLAVVSACESAVADIGQLPQEVISIGAVLLAAGAAGAIASLWQVPSLATSMLMARFYEELLASEQDPAVALTAAQLWLRALTGAQESSYLTTHPALKAEFGRLSAIADPPGRRGKGVAAAGADRPYSHPDYWAAFVLIGV